jgi:hypothetical protein
MADQHRNHRSFIGFLAAQLLARAAPALESHAPDIVVVAPPFLDPAFSFPSRKMLLLSSGKAPPGLY